MLPLTIGLVSFVYLFGFERAIGEGGEFDWPGGDLSQHVAGAFAYLDAPWSLPLFFTDRINYPDGVNIIFTDSAPFAGLIAKLIYTFVGIRWNYLGSWFFILWVGQAVSASILVRELGGRHWIPMTCGSITALFFQPFLLRHVHLALSSHFLIILALAAYFHFQKQRATARGFFLWLITILISMMTHIYIFAIVVTIFIAFLIDNLIKFKEYFRVSAIYTLLIFFIIFLWALVSGVLTRSGSDIIGGYDIYSMNILSPLWPVLSYYFGGAYPWERGGLEGYNYLGVASILLATFAVGLKPSLKAYALHYPALVFILICFTAYALSTTIWFGTHLVYSMPYPQYPPFTIFRASGRFFWPVAYLVLLVPIAVVWKNKVELGVASSIMILTATSLSQVVESRLWVEHVQSGSVSPLAAEMVDFIALQDSVDIYPLHQCSHSIEEGQKISQIVAFAARLGRKVNTADQARAHVPQSCDVPAQAGKAEIFLMTPPPNRRNCKEIPGAILCRLIPSISESSVKIPLGDFVPAESVALTGQ